jgi:hypothetical protein
VSLVLDGLLFHAWFAEVEDQPLSTRQPRADTVPGPVFSDLAEGVIWLR